MQPSATLLTLATGDPVRTRQRECTYRSPGARGFLGPSLMRPDAGWRPALVAPVRRPTLAARVPHAVKAPWPTWPRSPSRAGSFSLYGHDREDSCSAAVFLPHDSAWTGGAAASRSDQETTRRSCCCSLVSASRILDTTSGLAGG